ncbi:MAG: tyrosine--tRNA ligase, partial [Clostridia bacterium]|nr:tyrosine--tRNA ligase [Clostridia bacterium]
MQFGGDDQWSNMLAGTELIRKKSGKDAYAMTITLLLNSEGKKMGKTAKGAVWLDPEKTAPFDFYQYWRNVDDADVMKCIKMLTFIPLDEIADMETWPDSRINEKKEILAYALTTLVHGEEEAKKAQITSKALFSGGEDDSLMPTTEVPAGSLVEGETGVIDLLVLSGIAKSRGEARRLIEQGGITLDGEAVTDFGKKVTAEQLKNGIKIRKGKKTHRKFIIA